MEVSLILKNSGKDLRIFLMSFYIRDPLPKTHHRVSQVVDPGVKLTECISL
jgi:hypothetical protein